MANGIKCKVIASFNFGIFEMKVNIEVTRNEIFQTKKE